MGKKSIPILVAAMVLALLGTIVIQYLWIERSYQEKKSQIDYSVREAIAVVDQKMNDYSRLFFFSSDPLMVDSTNGVNTFFSHNTTWEDSIDKNANLSSDIEERHIEITILADDSTFDLSSVLPKDSVIETYRIHSTDTSSDFMFSQMKDLYERIRYESVTDSVGISRVDSVLFSEEMDKALHGKGFELPNQWAIYDTNEDDYSVNHLSTDSWNMTIPLFNEDVFEPGRYVLRMDTTNYYASIFKEIIFMIILSIFFLCVIILVFTYAIRLLLKHKKVSKIKSDFINNMTHEFKTPLASISLAADSILHPKIMGDEEKVKNYIRIIQGEKEKLNKHVETILEAAAIESNGLKIETERLPINQLIHETIEKMRLFTSEHHANVTLELDQEQLIHTNTYHFHNVLSNLIENAIKYSGDAPEIQIRTKHEDGVTLLTIADNGIGMTKGQIARAFDHFYRAQTGNIHNTKGFGLGLSFVKRVMEEIGGKVTIDSTIQKGTTVTLTFIQAI